MLLNRKDTIAQYDQEFGQWLVTGFRSFQIDAECMRHKHVYEEMF